MQQKLIEFEAIGVAKVVNPVIDVSSTPDIWVAFSHWDRGHPISNVKSERIKTVVIFCDKGRFVPILEHSTGTDVGNVSKNLGRDLFTSLDCSLPLCRIYIALGFTHVTVLAKLQSHPHKRPSVLCSSWVWLVSHHVNHMAPLWVGNFAEQIGPWKRVQSCKCQMHKYDAMPPQIRAAAGCKMARCCCAAVPVSPPLLVSPLVRLIRVNPLLVARITSSQVPRTNPGTAPWNAPSLPTWWCPALSYRDSSSESYI